MKRYSASDRPAVADLSRTIPAGAICVVIGSRSAFSSAAMSCRRCARVPRRRAAGCCSGWMTLRGCTAAYAGDDRADRHRHRHRGRDRRLRGTSLTHAPSWRRRSTTAVVAEAPAPRCEFVEAEPEWSLPALVLGEVDLLLADECPCQPRACGRHRPRGPAPRAGLPRAPRGPPGCAPSPPRRAACRARRRDPDDRPSRHALQQTVSRTCREFGAFRPPTSAPDERRGRESRARRAEPRRGASSQTRALRTTPAWVVREIADGVVERTILVATRSVDAKRPPVQAALAAIRAAAASLK